ncbi:hypothetical protein GCU69_21315 [Streptomyces lycii]|uniref:histidine kinase n=1 Tax=Streptomyces lycii TaxID=2654337 RepID=A0ABQ7FDJ7_9ACTN|nr:hypothetical protein GCU69_21315 [Streptomyces lycii]
MDLAAYRIVQESLTNVARHAAARRATVTVRRSADELLLRVEDDGRGAAGPDATATGSGVRGMAERAESLGGTFSARNTDTGFRVEARIPLPPGDSGPDSRTPATDRRPPPQSKQTPQAAQSKQPPQTSQSEQTPRVPQDKQTPPPTPPTSPPPPPASGTDSPAESDPNR